jgi:hypothetical protein
MQSKKSKLKNAEFFNLHFAIKILQFANALISPFCVLCELRGEFLAPLRLCVKQFPSLRLDD